MDDVGMLLLGLAIIVGFFAWVLTIDGPGLISGLVGLMALGIAFLSGNLNHNELLKNFLLDACPEQARVRNERMFTCVVPMRVPIMDGKVKGGLLFFTMPPKAPNEEPRVQTNK